MSQFTGHVRQPDRHPRSRRHPKLALRLVEHAGQHSPASGENAACSQCLDHPALAVDSPSDLSALGVRLAEAGHEADLHEDRSGAPMLTFRDPDNIQLELWLPIGQ